MKDIVLALGGGGVKGYAHIGVLRQLERSGFRVRAVAGTSAGGLVGAPYAAGYHPDEIEQILAALDQSRLYGRLPEDGPSMLGLAGVIAALDEMLADCNFRDLLLPFGVTAVDLQAAQLVTIRRGPVIDAVLATIAVPGVFPPRSLGGRILIDGGILDPVPVRLARQLAPGYPVVAVTLSPPLDAWQTPDPPRLLNSMPFLTTYLSRLRIARALNVFMQSIDISGASMNAMRLELDRPEVILRPAVPAIGLLDTVAVSEVAELGEQVVRDNLDELERIVGWRAWAGRRLRPPPAPELPEVGLETDAAAAAPWRPKRPLESPPIPQPEAVDVPPE